MDLRGCRNADTVANNLTFAINDMPAHASNRHARVALLVDRDDHSHDFIEAACQCAGLDVVLFNDRAAAEQHLQSEP